MTEFHFYIVGVLCVYVQKFKQVKCKQFRCAERTMCVCVSVCLNYNWLKGVTVCLCAYVRACVCMHVCDAENRRFLNAKFRPAIVVIHNLMHFERRSNERCVERRKMQQQLMEVLAVAGAWF